MDHARCAALHNYLMSYAWTAEGRSPEDWDANSTFFTTNGLAAEAIRPRLDPLLAAFLDKAIVPPIDVDAPPLFLLGGEVDGGLFYHQSYHRAAVFMHMDDYGLALSVREHEELWHPLETILSNWISLVDIGKVTASPRDAPSLFDNEKIGPWVWQPYSETQVDSCIRAWDRLCEAIETRRAALQAQPVQRSPDNANNALEPHPLVHPSLLDAARIPDPSFARSFLTRARRPAFSCTAPGLFPPPTDPEAFLSTQPFTTNHREPNSIIPPVCLFPAGPGILSHPATNPCSTAGFYTPTSPSTPCILPCPIQAGLYSEAVDRTCFDTAEEGFRLLLPYPLSQGHGNPSTAPAGARTSDGAFIDRQRVDGLFQHGYKPFGGDYHRPQRLERVLEAWEGLVSRGVWGVGREGVKGSVERFTEAEGWRWREYVVKASW
ncbi:hypothetical protein C8A05DRAFT_48257 [Staphylotrichum tortipilum]|uniref:Uncharacterized protein n=1 Tax=Staphylotrichum tortipilum TaxID=2831512 RepID=A0AAN6MBE7_9PEZI|nr:hypothetical protein C8A05DRAFT_48257 [Staphylotrichum longicolle]